MSLKILAVSYGKVIIKYQTFYQLACFLLFVAPGMPSSTGSSLDCVQDENPPHWLKSLQALTEMDGPSGSVVSQPRHSGMIDSAVRLPLHRGSWAPYLPPPSLAPSHFHSPPPGFQTAFRPPAQTTTDLLQSAAMERH